MVAYSQGDMVAWALLAPRVHEFVQRPHNPNPGVWIADIQDRARNDLADRVDEFKGIAGGKLRQV